MRSVLIVDDDPFIRKLVATTLEDVAGFQLHEAANGVEAVQRASEIHPELVFLDIDMPRMDGIEACRLLRDQDTGGATATIVMLTAAGASENETRAKSAGADLFLTKPFSPLDLLRLVDELA
ncbi:MAG: two-component system, chemotaxis family, chemotaxis protein CheY [Baekduia sp.]|jgi:two-component system chemotaxis response regulator CheY|nr:two-component system, chemotaxis family, chemotaxis protein CheY [Baekduia sp.]MDX6727043.1 two-component system, chemotaxis family, chemotaxis protein CheY [Baekduia sp.]